MNNCLFEEPQNPPNKENCNGSTTQDRNHKTIKIFDKNHRNPMKQLRHVMTLKQQHQPDLVVRNQKVKKKLPSCQKIMQFTKCAKPILLLQNRLLAVESSTVWNFNNFSKCYDFFVKLILDILNFYFCVCLQFSISHKI